MSFGQSAGTSVAAAPAWAVALAMGPILVHAPCSAFTIPIDENEDDEDEEDEEEDDDEGRLQARRGQ